MMKILDVIRALIHRQPTFLVDIISGATSIGWGIIFLMNPEALKLSSYQQLSNRLDALEIGIGLFSFVIVVLGIVQILSIITVNGMVQGFLHRILQLGAAMFWGFIAIMFWTVHGSPISTAVVPYTLLSFMSIWAFIEFRRSL